MKKRSLTATAAPGLHAGVFTSCGLTPDSVTSPAAKYSPVYFCDRHLDFHLLLPSIASRSNSMSNHSLMSQYSTALMARCWQLYCFGSRNFTADTAKFVMLSSADF